MTPAKRQWALVLLGAWMAGTICVSVVATQNFYTIDRLLAARANEEFAAVADRLGATESRDFLRYVSSELNRLYFQLWNGAQIVVEAQPHRGASTAASSRERSRSHRSSVDRAAFYDLTSTTSGG